MIFINPHVFTTGGGQTVVTIGTGTGTSVYALPFNRNYNYAWTYNMYTQAQIATLGSISSIAFDNTLGTDDLTWTSQSIYMKHTSATTAPTARPTASELTNNWTLVFSGTIAYDAAYKTIALDTAFSYNNSDNLLIYYLNYMGTNNINGPVFYYTTNAANLATYYRNDTKATFDANTTGTNLTRHANIKLTIDT